MNTAQNATPIEVLHSVHQDTATLMRLKALIPLRKNYSAMKGKAPRPCA
jgi:hypothetical protein